MCCSVFCSGVLQCNMYCRVGAVAQESTIVLYTHIRRVFPPLFLLFSSSFPPPLQAAAGLKGEVTTLEGDLIDALTARSSLEVKEAADPTKLSMGNDPALNVAYAAAMKSVFEKYPNDVDMSALYVYS